MSKNKKRLIDDLEQIAANLDTAAGNCDDDYMSPEQVLQQAASDIRVALDTLEQKVILELDDAEIEEMQDGSSVERILERDGRRTSKLEVVWKTEIGMDSDADEFVSPIMKQIQSGETHEQR